MLENNLRDDIIQNGAYKRYQNCKKNLGNDLNAALNTMQEKIDGIGTQITTVIDDINALTEAKIRLSNYEHKFQPRDWENETFDLSDDVKKQITAAVENGFRKAKNDSQSLFAAVGRGKRVSIDAYNEFLTKACGYANEDVKNLLKNRYFEDIKNGDKTVIALLNEKINDLKEQHPDDCKPLQLFGNQVTLENSLPDDFVLQTVTYARKAATSKIKFTPISITHNKDVIGEAAVEDDIKVIAEKYQDEAKRALNGVIRRMMAQKLNNQCRKYLRASLDEKDEELTRKQAERTQLEGEKRAFGRAQNQINDLKKQIEEL